MISLMYSQLSAGDKLIYFEAATNSTLQKLLKEELDLIETEILNMTKSSAETQEDFMYKFTKLSLNRTLLTEFLSINEQVIEEIHNQQQN